jgi:hypothetical protein
MGPTKALLKDNEIYEATRGTILKDGFANHDEVTHYVNHHYVVLPAHDNHGSPTVLSNTRAIACFDRTRFTKANGVAPT